MGKLALLSLCLFCGCPAAEKIVVMRAGDPCLFVPPPDPKTVSYRCLISLPGYVACLDGKNADTLGDNLEASKRWQDEAWLRCGPSPDAGK